MVQDSKGNKEQFARLDAEFLVANPHGIFGVDDDYNVNEFSQYWAIGCGAPYAMGAFEAVLPYPESLGCDETAREVLCRAMKVSARLSVGVGGRSGDYQVEVFKAK